MRDEHTHHISEEDYDPYSAAEGSGRLWNRNYILAMTANFLLAFSLYCLMPILPIYLSEEYHAGRDVIGKVMGSFIITALMIRPFSGYLVDSFPRKRVLFICYLVFTVINVGYVLASAVAVFGIVRAMQGFAFGATTVSNSTVAIDVLPSCRRNEGIGYYGISNNLAMAIGPSVALFLYSHIDNTVLSFSVPLLSSIAGLCCVAGIRNRPRAIVKTRLPMSLDRFYLATSVPEGLTLTTFSFASATLTTYLAIYSDQELGILSGSGVYFLIMSAGLIFSRLMTNKWVRQGYIVENVKAGMLLITGGFVIFTALQGLVPYYVSAFVIGLGYGTMCPSYQSMFINLAPNSRRGTANSSYLTSWDVGAGLGIFSAGDIAELTSYHTVYLICLGLCVAGAISYFFFTSHHYVRLRLR